MQLEPRAVIRIHHQDGLIDELALEGHRFLSRADGLDDDVIKSFLREQSQTIFRRRRQPTSLAARGHAAHEYAVMLRVDHRRPIPKQRAVAYDTRVVRENRDPGLRIMP